MKTYGGMEVFLHAFPTGALDGGEWSASQPVTIWQEATWAPEPVWTGWPRKK